MARWNWSKKSPDKPADANSSRSAFAKLVSDTDRRIVAIRAAMRAYPGTVEIGDGVWELGKEIDLPIRLQAFRVIFVSWAECLYPGIRQTARDEAIAAMRIPLAKFDEGLPDFYHRNKMGSDYAVGAWQSSAEAARRAVAFVEAIETLSYDELPFDQGRDHADFLHTSNRFGPNGQKEDRDWRSAQAVAMEADCAGLATGVVDRRDLALKPLWPKPKFAALETNVMLAASYRNARQLGFNIECWLRERKDGQLVFGRTVDDARELTVRTANLPPTFWEREDAMDALCALDYSLLGYLDNPSWGSDTRICDQYERKRRSGG